MISRRSLSRVALAVLALAAASKALAGEIRPIVVELFTSQGCSSCPPADAVLAKLADRKDVLAISLPVTYWDMFGWKDTLASAANTRRQKAYAASMGHGGVYTPQMIVDGATDVVGSRGGAVDAAIAARKADMIVVPVTVRASPDELHIAVGGGATTSNSATIWLFQILGQASVRVGGGENAGRSLTYRNVVQDVKPVGLWKGEAVSLDLPRASDTTHDSFAVVVQQTGYGRIVGAAQTGRPVYASLW
jgi:hypothetical protein